MKPLRTTKNGVNLSTVQNGQSVRIKELHGGHSYLSRLASLGFTPGAMLRVVQNFGHGPIIVNLRDTRIALGRGEASKIEVEQIGVSHPRGHHGR